MCLTWLKSPSRQTYMYLGAVHIAKREMTLHDLDLTLFLKSIVVIPMKHYWDIARGKEHLVTVYDLK